MPKLDFDGDIMRQYNDKGILIYEGGYAEYEGETVGLGVAICKSGEGKEYFDNGDLKYEGDFKNGKYDGFGKEYYDFDGSIRFEGERKNGDFVKGKRYNPSGITYDGEFNEKGEKHGHGKRIRDGILYYDGEFSHDEIHGKGRLYDSKGVLAYDGDFVEARREGYGKYYEDGKLVYEGERKDGNPVTPRKGYDQEKEDKRYDEGNLCGRFWGMGTALLEHRKGTIGLG